MTCSSVVADPEIQREWSSSTSTRLWSILILSYTNTPSTKACVQVTLD